MQDKRQGRVVNQEARMQYIKKQKRSKRILIVFGILTWGFIALNLFLLLQVQARTKGINELLERANSHLAMQEQDFNLSSGEDEVIKNPGASEPGGAVYGEAEPQPVSNLEQSYASRCGLESVDKPVDRSEKEVLLRLKELGAESSLIQGIWENNEKYPKKLLEALANNPEMADFVSGYSQTTAKAAGGLTDRERNESFPLFLQWDPRWGYIEYGDGSCIGLAGCGPTCLSMVLYYLTNDDGLTPDKLAAYSMDNGYYMSGTGTAWALLSEVPGIYGIDVSEPAASKRELEAALDEGGLVICSMGKGDFTVAGHFIVIYGYDEEGFLVNDPNCVARSRKHWTWEEIEKQIKHTWVFSKGDAKDVTGYYGGNYRDTAVQYSVR